MAVYVGIDLHSNNMYVVMMDEDEKILYQQRISNEVEPLLRLMSTYPKNDISAVVESTFNWYWLVDALQSEGYSIVLANPAALKPYSGLKYTDDRSDATWLARMLKMNLIQTGYIYPKEERPIRDLMRRRTTLVQQKTQSILSLKSLIHRETGKRVSTNMVTNERNPLPIEELFENEDLIFTAEILLANIYAKKKILYRLEKRVETKIKLKPAFARLTSIDGIGTILAITIMLEVGDIARFKTVGDFVSYCRCVSSVRTSNDKIKGKNNRKNGNRYLEWAFVEAAIFIRRYNDTAQRYYQKKLAKTNKIVATKTLAHKLARAAFYIMRDDVPFDQNKLFSL